MAENILEVRNLSKNYGDFVLDRVSFTIPGGAVVGLIGENGAGKPPRSTVFCMKSKNIRRSSDFR